MEQECTVTVMLDNTTCPSFKNCTDGGYKIFDGQVLISSNYSCFWEGRTLSLRNWIMPPSNITFYMDCTWSFDPTLYKNKKQGLNNQCKAFTLDEVPGSGSDFLRKRDANSWEQWLRKAWEFLKTNILLSSITILGVCICLACLWRSRCFGCFY